MILLALAFPGLLLGVMIAMERVERPLRDEAIGDQLAVFLETARPDEVETYVSEGLSSALDRYWKRRSLLHRLQVRRLVTRS